MLRCICWECATISVMVATKARKYPWLNFHGYPDLEGGILQLLAEGLGLERCAIPNCLGIVARG